MRQRALSVLTALGVSSIAIGAAVEPPQMKPGLWEIRMQHSADGKVNVQPPSTVKQCKDATELARARVAAEEYARKNCSKNDSRQDGSKWVNDTVCKVGASTMTTHSVTDAAGDTAFHTESTSTFEPPTPGHSRSTTTIDAKWLSGSCPH
jgi:uncharacterized protein DUF3617